MYFTNLQTVHKEKHKNPREWNFFCEKHIEFAQQIKKLGKWIFEKKVFVNS